MLLVLDLHFLVCHLRLQTQDLVCDGVLLGVVGSAHFLDEPIFLLQLLFELVDVLLCLLHVLDVLDGLLLYLCFGVAAPVGGVVPVTGH